MDPKRRGGATRRRGEELETAILDAAWSVLVEQGYSGFTYEAVASRAGTSRPVLYRRWPQRTDLLLATLGRSWTPLAVPDTGSLREDTLTYLRSAVQTRTHLITMLGVQLQEFFRDSSTTFVQLRDRLRPPEQPNALEIAVGRAIRRGEIPDIARSPRVIALPFDLLRHEMLVTMRPIPENVIVEIVDDIWLPLLRSGAEP